MVNAQEWLNENYPKNGLCKDEKDGWRNVNENFDKKREEIVELNINDKELDGSLTLEEFVNLKKIVCSGNKLTELKLVNLDSLEELDCSGNDLNNLIITNSSQHVANNIKYLNCSKNCLRDLEFLNTLNPETLTILHLWNNRFSEKNLNCFQKFINLRRLSISNFGHEKFCNRFCGNLNPLKSLTKLQFLYIDDTDIDSGLEYLPNSMQEFHCSARKKPETKVKRLEQELRKFGDPKQGVYGSQNFSDLLKTWKEFNSPAQQWLDKEYPKNGVCQLWTPKKGEEWNNKGKKREKITKLDVSQQELKGGLSLKGFTNLEELDCSDNQLTNLDLRHCPNLTELKCDNNELRSLDLFKTLSNSEKLEKLWMQNNLGLMTKNLSYLVSLTNLEILDISGCSKIKGSLKSLEKLVKLRWLDISNTDIKEGLEHLPKSIKNFYCELDYDYGSVEIAKKLGKFSEGADEKSDHTKYNLDKWRIDQANNKTVSSISLERLFVIRSNIKQFINKWDKRGDSKNNHDSEQKSELLKIVDSIKELEDKVIAHRQGSEQIITQSLESSQLENQNIINSADSHNWFKKEDNLSELDQLRTPEQYGKFRYLGGVKWIARATAAAGGVLALADQPIIGGAMAAASPFIDAIATHIEENYYEKKEEKWKEFQNDVDTLLDNYHELLGMTKSIKVGELGEVNQAFRGLKKEVDNFLKEFDEDRNGEIDVKELVAKRNRLFRSQNNETVSTYIRENQPEQTAISITEEENRQSCNPSSDNLLNKSKQKEEIEMKELEISEDFREQPSTQAQIEQSPK